MENALAIMTIVMYGGNRVHHPNREAWGCQHHVVGVLCCRRDSYTSQNRWHYEEGKLCEDIEAASRDISQELNAWVQMRECCKMIPLLHSLRISPHSRIQSAQF